MTPLLYLGGGILLEGVRWMMVGCFSRTNPSVTAGGDGHFLGAGNGEDGNFVEFHAKQICRAVHTPFAPTLEEAGGQGRGSPPAAPLFMAMHRSGCGTGGHAVSWALHSTCLRCFSILPNREEIGHILKPLRGVSAPPSHRRVVPSDSQHGEPAVAPPHVPNQGPPGGPVA